MAFEKKDIVLISAIVAAIIIAFWGVTFNHGELIVNSSEINYTVQAGRTNVECVKNPCVVKLTPKSYKVRLVKNGFSTSEESVEIARGRSASIDYFPVEVPKIEPLAQNPQPLFNGRLGQTAQGQQYILNQEIVTTFPDPLPAVAEVAISPSGKYSVVYVPADLPQVYLIDNIEKSKSLEALEVLHDTTVVSFLDDQNMLLDFEGGVIMYNLQNRTSKTLPAISGKHIYCNVPSSCFMLSPYSPQTKNSSSSSSDTNLFSSIVEEEGVNFFRSDSNPVYKLYSFNADTLEYMFLADIPGFVDTPRQIFKAQVGDSVSLVIENEQGKFFELAQ